MIEFKCDPNAGKGQGPTFVAESGRCSYLFNWYTNIVCQSQTILQNCATTDAAGKTYDLSVLRNHGPSTPQPPFISVEMGNNPGNPVSWPVA